MGQASINTTAPASSPGARPEVQAAIARAAQATGVDFSYLLAQARLESSLNPAARASTSSAAGLYQFTGGTWLQTLKKHGAAHGLDWADAAIDRGRVADPLLRQQVLALRNDPDLSARMAAELARDNRDALVPVLGREPDAAELYLAHFLGAGGAGQFLSALAADPAQSAAAILPEAAAANRAIFYDGGQPRSLGAVMGLLRDKVGQAMDRPAGAMPWPTSTAATAWQPLAAPLSYAPRPAMSDVLSAAFGLGASTSSARAGLGASKNAAQPEPVEGGDRQRDLVSQAYGKFKAFGL